MAGGVWGGFVEHKAACCMCSCFVRQWIKDDTERRTNWFDKITGVSVARKSNAAPVVSASLSRCLPLSSLETPGYRTSQEFRLDFQDVDKLTMVSMPGDCVCLGPVCFEKYQRGLAVTNLFFNTCFGKTLHLLCTIHSLHALTQGVKKLCARHKS